MIKQKKLSIMNLHAIKQGDRVKFSVNGKVHNILNYVARVTAKEIHVQVNNAGSILHGSLLVFPKDTNEVKVSCYGTAIYKIAY